MRVSRRDFIKSLIGGSVSSALMCNKGNERHRPMNVLFIMTDQQPVRTLGCYGNHLNPTPNLDRLAGSGIRFSNFYIGAFPCSPSRATMFTGCYPQQHGIFTNNIMLNDDIPSMGYILRDGGYVTAYFGKSHLKGHMYRDVAWRKPFHGSWYNERIPDDRAFRMEQKKGGLGEDLPQLGFEQWAGGWKNYHTYLKKVGLEDLLEKRPMPGNHQDLPSASNDEHRYSLIPEEHHMAAFFTQKARQFLLDHEGNDQPFCMVLSYYGPHLPVAPPRPWNKKYTLDQCPLPENHYDALQGKPASQRKNTYCYKLPDWNEDQFRDYIRRYYGYCAYIDAQIGRVLDTLKTCGFENNTIVIFTSDHGDMMGSHGFIYKINDACYQELSHVPFLMRIPGVTKSGSVCRSLVSSVDIFPTLLELIGKDIPRTVQGRSFVNLLRRPESHFRDRLYTHWGPRSIVSLDGEWKYGLHGGAEIDELYNLYQDPGELKNLVSNNKYTHIAEKKRREILAWLDETSHPYELLFWKKES